MTTTKGTTSTTLAIPSELAEAIDRVALRAGRAREEIAEQWLREALAREASPPPAKPVEPDSTWPTVVGIIDGSPVSSEDFEDWLLAHWRPDESGERS